MRDGGQFSISHPAAEFHSSAVIKEQVATLQGIQQSSKKTQRNEKMVRSVSFLNRPVWPCGLGSIVE